jgi:hypothetical protein
VRTGSFFPDGMAVLIALVMVAVRAVAARSISCGELREEKSRPASTMVVSKRFQSAACQLRRRVGVMGMVLWRVRLQMEWSDVELSLSAQDRTEASMGPLTNPRSMVDGFCLFRGKWVGLPGTLRR